MGVRCCGIAVNRAKGETGAKSRVTNAKWLKTKRRVKLAGIFAKDRFDAAINLADLDFLWAARVTNGRMATSPHVVGGVVTPWV